MLTWSWRIEPESPKLDAVLPDTAPEFIVHLGNPAGIERMRRLEATIADVPILCRPSFGPLIAERSIDLSAIRFRLWGARVFGDPAKDCWPTHCWPTRSRKFLTGIC